MVLSKNAILLKKLIDKAIEDHRLTRKEYDEILELAHEDGVVDKQEQALLSQLQEMINDKSVKMVP